MKLPGAMRKRIGSSVWLLSFLAGWVKADWDGLERLPVEYGTPLTDRDLALLLEVKPATVARWRLRARRAGLLYWQDDPDTGGRVFFFEPLKKAFPEAVSKAPSQPVQMEAQQTQEISKWVQ